MYFKKFIAFHQNMHFIIDEDLPIVGAVLYICKGKKVIRDEMQNSIQACKDVAFKTYNVPYEKWAELNDLKDFPWLED